jgi:hypothetical protein
MACLFFWAAAGFGAQLAAAERDLASPAPAFLKRYCFDCHAGSEPEAQIDLKRMLAEPSLATSFKRWQKVAWMVDQTKMPPEEAPQPDEAERKSVVALLRGALREVARRHAGDPGPVLMRRLTGAEYAYTMSDLTGLDLKLDRDFVSDAVGGEGFANTGVVQFMQDSTLERYLDAAKRVAAHAVIGAGPLQFYHDPGKTGYELSAITRIQEIYRSHGFRTASGEGGEPFGLDRYARAFYLAWRYRHRERLGLGQATLADVAAAEQIDSRFAAHIWSVLNDDAPSFPTSEVVARWHGLPHPDGLDEEGRQSVRKDCDELYRLMNDWQTRLAGSTADREETSVLTEASLHASPTHVFKTVLARPKEGASSVRMNLSVVIVERNQDVKPVVIWKNPRLRFRALPGSREDEQPLKGVLTAGQVRDFAFGHHPSGGTMAPDDFATTGAISQTVEIPVPAGTRRIALEVEVQLDVLNGDDCAVRCVIADGEADTLGRVSALLANPDRPSFPSWKAGVFEFARQLPQISHREPAPSDRDPIPYPFDNSYNGRERDYFHYKVKYWRDDRFVYEKILDDQTRRRLDDAWIDLLSSFEYHDVLYRFVAEKRQLDLAARSVAEFDDDQIAALPEDLQTYVRRLHDESRSVQMALKAAQPAHLADALEFASLAWRRPLRRDEKDRLLAFYENLRRESQLDHPQAVRALLTRILVAPDFLYRVEKPIGDADVVALPDWELAARLSYFLWASPPDAELRRAAAAGELGSKEALIAQARRMLRDTKARRFATEFFGQWFGFYQFDRFRGVDLERFPEFTDRLKSALYDEAVTFFEHLVSSDRPVSEILFADYAFLNRDLARHYAIDEDVSSTFPVRVEGANRFHRGGLLSLGAVLTVTSAPLRTSPVKRGDWVLRRVLGTVVPPPPADAGTIEGEDVISGGKTMRERLEAHRRLPSCTNCHSRIDPLGFALEHFDSLGRWREQYRDGKSIDASGTLADGTAISELEGLRRHLQSQMPQFERTLAAKLVAYALGRGELVSEAELIEQMTAGLSEDNRFSSLIVKIVGSPQFRTVRGASDARAEAAITEPVSKSGRKHDDR